MITIAQSVEIDAGHRLLRHEGKCRHYHGHRYKFVVHVAACELDAVGRVVDFGVIKERFGGWLLAQWDHGMVLEAGDPLIAPLQVEGMRVDVLSCAPTAENLAAIAYFRARELLAAPLRVVGMRVYETPHCWADFRPEKAV